MEPHLNICCLNQSWVSTYWNSSLTRIISLQITWKWMLIFFFLLLLQRKEKTKENNHKKLPVCFLLFFYFFLEESEGRETDFTSVFWLQQFTGQCAEILGCCSWFIWVSPQQVLTTFKVRVALGGWEQSTFLCWAADASFELWMMLGTRNGHFCREQTVPFRRTLSQTTPFPWASLRAKYPFCVWLWIHISIL